MNTATYFEMILSILIWLTLISLILLFMYMFHGRGEETEKGITRVNPIYFSVTKIFNADQW